MASSMVRGELAMDESAAREAVPVGTGALVIREKVRSAPSQSADPVFIFSAPRSFSSVVCAMLGQHPQMHGLPETHLFADETMDGWLVRSSQETYPMAHGLLRAVAQLCYGEQTEDSVKRAVGWLMRRTSSTSGIVFEELALQVAPAILIDKSPSMVYTVDAMRRVHRFFPQARFIHLVRHPRGQGHSVLKYRKTLTKPEYQSKEREVEAGTIPDWVNTLASFPYAPEEQVAEPDSPEVDPQRGWYVLNRNIVEFLKSLPGHQWVTIRGEDLLTDPDAGLSGIAEWLGLRTDGDAIERMKHPERSPYACFGPPGARCGNDLFFLQDPSLHPGRAEPQSLEGVLAWRGDGRGFLPEVKELAQKLGYQ
jgi:Sulfotransferase family